MKKLILFTFSMVILMTQILGQQLDDRGIPIQKPTESKLIHHFEYRFNNFHYEFETDSCGLSPEKLSWEFSEHFIQVVQFKNKQKLDFFVTTIPVIKCFDLSNESVQAKVYRTFLGNFLIIYDRTNTKFVAVLLEGKKQYYPIISKHK